jgi:hypothetical protein
VGDLVVLGSICLALFGVAFFSKACEDKEIDDFDDPEMRPILQGIGLAITIIGFMGFALSIRADR